MRLLSGTAAGDANPPRAWADDAGMSPDAVACALWIGLPLVAVDPTDPLPDGLDESVATYLALVHTAARA